VALRLGAGASIGTLAAGPPLWADGALLVARGGARWGWFAGVESVTAWASTVPALVAPEIALEGRVGDWPARLLVALPVSLGGPPGSTSIGAMLRLTAELDRD
jgi:hypothetical protein